MIKGTKINIPENKLRELYLKEDQTQDEIAEHFGVSSRTIFSRLKKFNISKNMKIEGLEEDKLRELFEDNGLTQKEIAKKFNVSRTTIVRRMKEYGIETDFKNRNVNENYFEEIENKSKAYWLGLITGDGGIHKGGVRIKLNKGDKHLLYDFKEDIESTHKITDLDTDNCKQVNITRKKIAEDLKELGLPENKTYKNISIPDVPKKYMSHYIRGLFDADGSVYKRKRYNGGSFQITGTEKLINEVNDIISNLIGHSNKVVRDGNSYELVYGAKDDLEKIYSYFYNNADRWMKRKRTKFEKIVKTN